MKLNEAAKTVTDLVNNEYSITIENYDNMYKLVLTRPQTEDEIEYSKNQNLPGLVGRLKSLFYKEVNNIPLYNIHSS